MRVFDTTAVGRVSVRASRFAREDLPELELADQSESQRAVEPGLDPPERPYRGGKGQAGHQRAGRAPASAP